MRPVSYETEGVWRAGLMVDEGIVDTSAAARQAGLPDAGPTGWLRDGDVVEIEFDEIGTLRNPVRGDPAVQLRTGATAGTASPGAPSSDVDGS